MFKGLSWRTSGLDIAKKISNKLADKAIVMKVHYLNREPGPFNTSKYLINISFSSK